MKKNRVGSKWGAIRKGLENPTEELTLGKESQGYLFRGMPRWSYDSSPSRRGCGVLHGLRETVGVTQADIIM